MKKAVLFDLGNTLVRYYERWEFPSLLERGIAQAARHLEEDGLLRVGSDAIRERVAAENHEAADCRVRPMEERLSRIFGIDLLRALDLCSDFMEPIFQLGVVYEDSLPILQALRTRGVKTGVVSNTPWGCPAELWRKELHRRGLLTSLDVAVFCRDVGWRKPDRRIFDRALQEVGVPAVECLYVGGNPNWDRVGPVRAGIPSVLVERGDYSFDGGPSARDLRGILPYL